MNIKLSNISNPIVSGEILLAFVESYASEKVGMMDTMKEELIDAYDLAETALLELDAFLQCGEFEQELEMHLPKTAEKICWLSTVCKAHTGNTFINRWINLPSKNARGTEEDYSSYADLLQSFTEQLDLHRLTDYDE